MCLNIQLDFFGEETQIQSMVCDLKSEINNSEESKVNHYEEKSDILNEQIIKLDREFNIAKCKQQIDIFSFNWMELNIIIVFGVV